MDNVVEEYLRSKGYRKVQSNEASGLGFFVSSLSILDKVLAGDTLEDAVKNWEGPDTPESHSLLRFLNGGFNTTYKEEWLKEIPELKTGKFEGNLVIVPKVHHPGPEYRSDCPEAIHTLDYDVYAGTPRSWGIPIMARWGGNEVDAAVIAFDLAGRKPVVVPMSSRSGKMFHLVHTIHLIEG